MACIILRADDLALLLARSASWAPAVDRIVVVLGAWSEHEPPKQLREAAAVLAQRWPQPTEIRMPPEQGWKDQVAKRSAYFHGLRVGDVAFVVDADEEVAEGPDALRAAAEQAFDVGWVTISAHPRYRRVYGQPRLFRVPPAGLCYQDRHYWVYTCSGQLVATHAYGGAGWHHSRLGLTLLNRGGQRRQAHRQQVARESRFEHSPLDINKDKREPLHILQVMRYDAGLAGYRLHSAINATTRDRSLMLSDQSQNPFAAPWQFDLRNRNLARSLVNAADVVHCHVDYRALSAAGGARAGQPVVIHHHGTVYRSSPETYDRADIRACLRLGSTMDVLNHDQTGTLQWLPNPVPVALYAAMARAARAERQDGEVWIAHSPSKPRLKGTDHLVAAVEALRKQGLPVRLALLHQMTHPEVLWRKAACDLCFDSFWLGIQVSGLEAAAMGQPVVAGDADTARGYTERIGQVPYTFADERGLREVLERLVVDADYRRAEAERVGRYVHQYHDEAAVARRYLELLRPALDGTAGFRQVLAEQIREERKVLAQALRPKPKDGQGVATHIIGTHFRLGKRARRL